MTAIVHTGDCLEYMRSLPDKSVDHVITDPQYEAEAHTLQRRSMRIVNGVRTTVVEPLPFPPMTPELRAAVGLEAGRLARRWVLAFCQVEAAMLWRVAFEAGGLRYMRTGIWRKPDGQPQITGDRPGMGYESICIMHGTAASRWNAGGKCGVWSFMRNQNGDHPTQKPLDLMRALVSDFTDPGETILDPFCGSGTTLVACEYLGRNSIGVELNPEWAELARRRVANVREQGTLAL